MINIYLIKQRANEIARQYRKQLVNVFIYIGVVSAIGTLLTSLLDGVVGVPYISFVFTILLSTIAHGYVVAGFKVVNDEDIDTQEVGLYGLKHFSSLISTYAVKILVVAAVNFAAALGAIGLILATGMKHISDIVDFIKLAIETNGDITSYDVPTSALEYLVAILPVIIIVFVVINIYMSMLIMFTEYITQDKGIKGFQALKEGMTLVKGYKRKVFSLHLSYFGWMVLSYIVYYIIMFIFGSVLNIAGLNTFIASVALAIISTLIYKTELQVALVCFYQELSEIKNPTVQETVEIIEEPITIVSEAEAIDEE